MTMTQKTKLITVGLVAGAGAIIASANGIKTAGVNAPAPDVAALSKTVAMAPSSAAATNKLPLSDPDDTAGWVLNSAVSDEFNGDALDLDKWNNLGKDGNYYGEWKGRAPSQFNSDNVSVGDGFLTLTSRWQPDFEFSPTKFNNGFFYGKPAPITTAAIISKAKFKYGYMEMRCKAADGPVSSAFWTTGQGGEIDVFEHFGESPNKPYSAKSYQSSFHDWRKGSPTFGKRIWTNEHQLGFRVADDFHVYGFEWDENYVRIFVDGRLVNTVTKAEMGDKWVATGEQKIWIDSETFDWEVKPAELTQAAFGDGQKYVVDYCRIWQRTKPAAPLQERTNLLANSGFKSGLEGWQGNGTLSEVAEEVKSGKKSVVLGEDGRIEQKVKVKPNTTYILSAWVRLPETNMKDVWTNSFLGAKDYGMKEDVNQRFFFPYYHERSVQFTTGPTATTAVVYFTNRPQGKKAIIDNVELVEAPAPQK